MIPKICPYEICNCNPHLTARVSLAAFEKSKWVERIGGPNAEPA